MKTTHFRIYLALMLFCITGFANAQELTPNKEALTGLWILDEVSIINLDESKSLKVDLDSLEQVVPDAIYNRFELYGDSIKILLNTGFYIQDLVEIDDRRIHFSPALAPFSYEYEIKEGEMHLSPINVTSLSNNEKSSSAQVLLKYKKSK